MNRRKLVMVVMVAFLAAACGETVLVQTQAPNPAANRQALQKEVQKEQKSSGGLSKGGNTSVNVRSTGGGSTCREKSMTTPSGANFDAASRRKIQMPILSAKSGTAPTAGSSAISLTRS